MIIPPLESKDDSAGFSVKNLRIEDNDFHLFQRSILKAISVNGLIFRNNTVEENKDYLPNIASNAPVFSFINTKSIDIEANKLPWKFSASDVLENDSHQITVQGFDPKIADGPSQMKEGQR